MWNLEQKAHEMAGKAAAGESMTSQSLFLGNIYKKLNEDYFGPGYSDRPWDPVVWMGADPIFIHHFMYISMLPVFWRVWSPRSRKILMENLVALEGHRKFLSGGCWQFYWAVKAGRCVELRPIQARWRKQVLNFEELLNEFEGISTSFWNNYGSLTCLRIDYTGLKALKGSPFTTPAF